MGSDSVRSNGHSPSSDSPHLGSGGREPDASSEEATVLVPAGRAAQPPRRSNPSRTTRSEQGPESNNQPSPQAILEAAKAARGSSVPCDGDFARRYPCLWELLIVNEGLSADGKNSTSLSITREGSVFSVYVSCRASGTSKQINLPQLTRFWENLEAALLDGNIPWREMRKWKAKEPKKEKGGKE